MKLVLTKQFLLTTAILLAGTACTNENNEGLPGNPSSPSDGDAIARREVLVTIKNKLTVTPTGTKAGEIATAEENKISSLDIYVFGAETENGTYTFQERFAYREDPAATPIPAGATSIDLAQEGDGKEASVSMKLKKGLFVKLYAIANQTSLVDPSGAIGTGTTVGATATLMQADDFKPLVLTNPGQQGTTVQTVGVPTETQFLAFHSPLLDAAIPGDVLNTPLPMSGANTVPTDLTDFEAFARIQASFKLTRTVA
ncbi:fimbrial protein, partial [Parabacteroides sp.]